jgi:acetylornithine deacetylase/succinyl-diaminopimelate desuccinylase-like protein
MGRLRASLIGSCLLLLPACAFQCGQKLATEPAFDADLAYAHILTYEKLGPKPVGSEALGRTTDWIRRELEATGAKVLVQEVKVKPPVGPEVTARNLIGQFDPEKKERVLLSAHYDTRPFADQETEPTRQKLPVPGVNDGGSGTAVLLTLANALKTSRPRVGVDLLFLDAEDAGIPSQENSYCLGTQAWAKNPVPAGYRARFGINFDMVGRIGAVFPVEGHSGARAGEVVRKVQGAAKALGLSDYFPDQRGGFVIDDHLYLMQGLGFPVMDLIHLSTGGGFPPEWHTLRDTSEFISRDTLKAVGQTTLRVLWTEEF